MANYFREPESFRVVNCKRVGGERARKACKKWNKLVRRRARAKKAGNTELVKQIEKEYYDND